MRAPILKREGFKGNRRFPLLDIQRHYILIRTLSSTARRPRDITVQVFQR